LYFPTFPRNGLRKLNATIESIVCIEIYDSIDMGFTRGEQAKHYTTESVFNDMKHALKRIFSKFILAIWYINYNWMFDSWFALALPHFVHVLSHTWIFKESILSVAHRWRKLALAVRFCYKVDHLLICMIFYNKSMIVYCEIRVLSFHALSCTEV
jgi:hypothetical protein